MRVIIQEEALRRSEKTHHHQFIHELPTIDAVPVVRCRECKYSDPHTTPDGKLYCVAMDEYFPSDGFCHEGEKMDGGAQE